jgi:hypothetical protein
MSTFFFLGAYLKVVYNVLSNTDFIDPIGNYNDSFSGAYVLYCLIFCFAMIFAKISFKFSAYKFTQAYKYKFINADSVSNISVLALIIVSILFYTINVQNAFFVTGVIPRTTLPSPLNVIISFMLFFGLPLLSTLFLLRNNIKIKGFGNYQVDVNDLISEKSDCPALKTNKSTLKEHKINHISFFIENK